MKFTGPWAKSVCFSDKGKGELVLRGKSRPPGRSWLVSQEFHARAFFAENAARETSRRSDEEGRRAHYGQAKVGCQTNLLGSCARNPRRAQVAQDQITR